MLSMQVVLATRLITKPLTKALLRLYKGSTKALLRLYEGSTKAVLRRSYVQVLLATRLISRAHVIAQSRAVAEGICVSSYSLHVCPRTS